MESHSKNAFEIFKILQSKKIVKNIKYLPDQKIKIINYGKSITQ